MSDGEAEPEPRAARMARVARKLSAALAAALAFGLGLWIGLPNEETHDPAAAASAEPGQLWTCSMHPQIKLPEPGDCPICGMDLIPIGNGTSSSPQQIELSEQARKLARVRTVRVGLTEASGELRLLGRVDYNERRVRTITPWIGGRIERLYVSEIGARISGGSTIARVYSPEVYTAHQDLIQARHQLGKLADAIPIAKKSAESALEAARQRLRLLGFRDPEIEKMEKEKRPRKSVRVRAPHSGTVVEQLVHEGAYVDPGTPLFRVADLSKLWVQLDAYESDLPRLEEGQTVQLEVEGLPGERYEGKIAFIDPMVDPQLRTARVRIEVKNDGKLRPGMFAHAVVAADESARSKQVPTIPRSAPLFTGKRSLVYVEVPDAKSPTYEPREVTLGPLAGERYPVLAGLKRGDRVVVHGAFMLDSELQIRGGPSMMARSGGTASIEPLRLPVAAQKLLAPIFDSYLDLQVLLTKDDTKGASAQFRKLGELVEKTQPKSPAKLVEQWETTGKQLSEHATEGADAADLKAARRAFRELSEVLIDFSKRAGNPTSKPIRLTFCPMAFESGAYWLQRQAEVENPYSGSEMFGCGSIESTIEPGQVLGPHADHREKQDASESTPKGGHSH